MSDNLDPMEARQLNEQVDGDEAAQQEDTLNPDNDQDQIDDILAAQRLDKQNHGGVVGGVAAKTGKWVRKNGLKAAFYIATSAVVGIGAVEALQATTGVTIEPMTKVFNYAAATLLAYPIVSVSRFVGKDLSILSSAFKDGMSHTNIVKKSKLLQKIFGQNRRFSDLQNRKAGELGGHVAGSVIVASVALFGAQYFNGLKYATTEFAPNAFTKTSQYFEDVSNGQSVRAEAEERGAADTATVFLAEDQESPWVHDLGVGREITMIDSNGEEVTLVKPQTSTEKITPVVTPASTLAP